MLWALKELSQLPLDLSKLKQWGSFIGSDVAFFFSKGCSYCEGRGEKILEQTIQLNKPMYLALVEESLSTPSVYAACVPNSQSTQDPRRILRDFIQGRLYFVNDLEPAAFSLCPKLAFFKKALEEVAGDFDKAIEILKIKGVAKAAKKVGRETPEGTITSYIHAGGKIGVMVEVNCETDFVARNEEFQSFAKEVAMQIAAGNPAYVDRESIPAEELEKEKEIMKAQVIESGKPDNIADKIVEGKIEKYYEEVCLLEQTYIRDSKVKINDLLQTLIGKIGENIKIRRFVRFQLGEPLQ